MVEKQSSHSYQNRPLYSVCLSLGRARNGIAQPAKRGNLEAKAERKAQHHRIIPCCHPLVVLRSKPLPRSISFFFYSILRESTRLARYPNQKALSFSTPLVGPAGYDGRSLARSVGGEGEGRGGWGKIIQYVPHVCCRSFFLKAITAAASPCAPERRSSTVSFTCDE
ncbi:hypothetical protein BJV74DRAFT_82912 [Russula compacta]|nr:hypothetical protein BJV74DRAFT_82912 [Russula compacta]